MTADRSSLGRLIILPVSIGEVALIPSWPGLMESNPQL
jgi:hypothetical protein